MSSVEQNTGGRGSRAGRLSPGMIRRTAFERSAMGRRGYQEAEVDRFVIRVADEIAWADAEKSELRAEIDRLRNYFRDQQIRLEGSAAAAPAKDPEPSVQAVNALSLAQQAADQHIAQAEDYARRLVGDARNQYEAILVDAHHQAQEAAAAAAEAYRLATESQAQVSGHGELEAKVAYLRTFTDVTQVQMRSILEALRQELDRLAQFGTGSIPIVREAPGQGGGPSGSEALAGEKSGSGPIRAAEHPSSSGLASGVPGGAQDRQALPTAPPRSGPAPIWSTATGDPRPAPSR